MYVRRKVFSILQDENGEERLYSTADLFYEGSEYEYVDDRLFAEAAAAAEEEDEKKKLTKGQKAALIAAGSTLAAAGLITGGKFAGKGLVKWAEKVGKNGHSKRAKWMETAGKGMQVPADKITELAKKSWDWGKGKFSKKSEGPVALIENQ